MTEEEFRQKYPHSTDEQVRLYCEAVALEAAGVTPVVEPDIPMPIITVPVPQVPVDTVTTYVVPSGMQYFLRNFSLSDVPPEGSSAGAAEMRDTLLGPFNAHLSPEQRQLFSATDMSADAMLAAFFDPKWTPCGLGSN